MRQEGGMQFAESVYLELVFFLGNFQSGVRDDFLRFFPDQNARELSPNCRPYNRRKNALKSFADSLEEGGIISFLECEGSTQESYSLCIICDNGCILEGSIDVVGDDGTCHIAINFIQTQGDDEFRSLLTFEYKPTDDSEATQVATKIWAHAQIEWKMTIPDLLPM